MTYYKNQGNTGKKVKRGGGATRHHTQEMEKNLMTCGVCPGPIRPPGRSSDRRTVGSVRFASVRSVRSLVVGR